MALHLCAVQLVALLGKCSLKSFDRVWQMFTFPAPFKILVCGSSPACGSSLYCTWFYCITNGSALYFTTVSSLAATVRLSVKWCCFAGVVVCNVLKGHSALYLEGPAVQEEILLELEEEEEGSMYHGEMLKRYLPSDTALHSGRLDFSPVLLWDPQVLHKSLQKMCIVSALT